MLCLRGAAVQCMFPIWQCILITSCDTKAYSYICRHEAIPGQAYTSKWYVYIVQRTWIKLIGRQCYCLQYVLYTIAQWWLQDSYVFLMAVSVGLAQTLPDQHPRLVLSVCRWKLNYEQDGFVEGYCGNIMSRCRHPFRDRSLCSTSHRTVCQCESIYRAPFICDNNLAI